jgi:hypothetical protein
MSAAAVVVPLNSGRERARLLAERDALMGEVSRLSMIGANRSAVESRLAELDREEEALNQAERAAWVEWTKTAEGPPPAPLTDQRADIAKRRAWTGLIGTS